MHVQQADRPSDVTESYVSHLIETTGITCWMLVGVMCGIIHAIFPFAFPRTQASIISHLNSRMLANRRRRMCPVELQDGGRFTLAE